ncbi:protein phosphatase 1 regulatory subunit 3C-B [Gadus chalcogrammus]|uniref:protein phosphatase 1 regulatory subunit 3C-B n=1 Tax=Gadus chalcogrammus TaxID=1042646 RepID=UPI0024C48D46|nr:protein phosphatase 1 regulatory subunit 3C-B [Gadus chalcogrammus]
MHCTRALPLTNPPMMPVDMAMRICLASSPPLCSFLGNYDNCRLANTLYPRCQDLRPCLAPGHADGNHGYEVSGPPVAISGGRLASSRAAPPRKKQVVFADARGLALADIIFYKEEDPLAELQFHLSDIEGALARLRQEENTGSDILDSSGLVLDFTPPFEDYLDLRQRLKAQQVSLENCSVQDGSLSGTIKVQNVSFEKSVSVRITFDSWISFRDVPCPYLNNVYSCPDTDTFSFDISLPEAVGESSKRVEFCICYTAQDEVFWDNNHGSNYGLVPSEPEPNPCPKTGGLEEVLEKLEGGRYAECDQFGSPRTSTGVFPGWQSWGRIENSAPYW